MYSQFPFFTLLIVAKCLSSNYQPQQNDGLSVLFAIMLPPELHTRLECCGQALKAVDLTGTAG